MKTLDEQLNDLAHEVRKAAGEVPERPWTRPVPGRRALVPVLAGIAVVAVFVGIPAMLLDVGVGDNSSPAGASVQTPEPEPAVGSEEVVSTTVAETDPQPGNTGPSVLGISTLSTSDPQVPDWPEDWERVDDILAESGIDYGDYPDFPRDAAIGSGVAVIAAGNINREAGIWFSADGAWARASMDLPSGMTIGESPGDHRLADGIQNVEALQDGFIAWEQVQLVGGGGQLDFVGTLVLVSRDGANWSGALYGEPDVSFTDFGEYGDGYLTTVSFYEGLSHYRTELLWADDIWGDVEWTSVVPIGGGYAHELIVDGSSAFILLQGYGSDSETESDDNGELSVVRVDLD